MNTSIGNIKNIKKLTRKIISRASNLALFGAVWASSTFARADDELSAVSKGIVKITGEADKLATSSIIRKRLFITIFYSL